MAGKKTPSTPWNSQLGIPPVSPEAAAQGTYMGSTFSYTPGRAAQNGQPGTSGAATIGANDTFINDSIAWSGWMNLPPAGKQQFDAIVNYVYPNGASLTQRQDLWSKGKMNSDYIVRTSGQRVDPLAALSMAIQSGNIPGGESRGGGGGGGGGGYNGPTTTNAISKSTNLTNPDTARGLVDTALSKFLGREATKHEQAQFMQALNAHEMKSPTITQQTTTSTPVGHDTNVSQQSMSQGGVDPAQFAEEWAQSQEGASEHSAAVGFLNTFLKSLGNPVG